MDNYEEILADAIERLVEKSRRELKSSDVTVRQLEQEIAELGEVVHNPNLDAEARQQVDLYLGKLITLGALREEHIYKQGAKDCIMLLKQIGVIQ